MTQLGSQLVPEQGAQHETQDSQAIYEALREELGVGAVRTSALVSANCGIIPVAVARVGHPEFWWVRVSGANRLCAVRCSSAAEHPTAATLRDLRFPEKKKPT